MTWGGKWKHQLDVSDLFHNDDLELPEMGRQVAERIRASRFWAKEMADDNDDADGELEMIVEELEDAAADDDERWFNACWSAFYDWCDYDKRVWVKTQ